MLRMRKAGFCCFGLLCTRDGATCEVYATVALSKAGGKTRRPAGYERIQSTCMSNIREPHCETRYHLGKIYNVSTHMSELIRESTLNEKYCAGT